MPRVYTTRRNFEKRYKVFFENKDIWLSGRLQLLFISNKKKFREASTYPKKDIASSVMPANLSRTLSGGRHPVFRIARTHGWQA